jgi:hypothetical protein
MSLREKLNNIIDAADAVTASRMLIASLEVRLVADPHRLLRGIVAAVDDDTIVRLMTTCQPLTTQLPDDAAKWRHCDLAPACLRDGHTCVHGFPAGTNHLPDGTVFYDVEPHGHDDDSDTTAYWVRRIYLSNGVLSEIWRCSQCITSERACEYISSSFKRAAADGSPPAKRIDDGASHL